MNLPEPFEMPIEYRRVSFGKRLAAVLIDSATAFVTGLLLGLFLIGVGLFELSMIDAAAVADLQEVYADLGLERSVATEVFLLTSAVGIGTTITSALLSLLELFIGASVGKLTLGLQIGHVDGRRGDVQLWTRRWIVKNLGTLVATVSLIPALSFLSIMGTLIGIVLFVGCFLALGNERLALHDRIAQTAVFRKEDVQ